MSPKAKAKERLDVLMVERGLETSRARAQARILAGDVVVADHRAEKPGQLVATDIAIRFKDNSLPYVSRGGLKLAAAIRQWPAPIAGAVCMDVGSSTGGFTEVLLENGAQKVYAVDVGYNELAYKLRIDPRVQVHERTHILKAPLGAFLPPPSICTIDVSFISLKRVLPGVLPHLANPAWLYVLIKPQFEVGQQSIAKGGIVRDEAARLQVVQDVIDLAKSLNLKVIGHSESPITGMDGNVEYLAALTTSP